MPNFNFNPNEAGTACTCDLCQPDSPRGWVPRETVANAAAAARAFNDQLRVARESIEAFSWESIDPALVRQRQVEPEPEPVRVQQLTVELADEPIVQYRVTVYAFVPGDSNETTTHYEQSLTAAQCRELINTYELCGWESHVMDRYNEMSFSKRGPRPRRGQERALTTVLYRVIRNRTIRDGWDDDSARDNLGEFYEELFEYDGDCDCAYYNSDCEHVEQRRERNAELRATFLTDTDDPDENIAHVANLEEVTA